MNGAEARPVEKGGTWGARAVFAVDAQGRVGGKFASESVTMVICGGLGGASLVAGVWPTADE